MSHFDVFCLCFLALYAVLAEIEKRAVIRREERKCHYSRKLLKKSQSSGLL